MVALVVARALLEKFGGDSLEETKRNYSGYMEQLRSYPDLA
jgi:chorismate synthase